MTYRDWMNEGCDMEQEAEEQAASDWALIVEAQQLATAIETQYVNATKSGTPSPRLFRIWQRAEARLLRRQGGPFDDEPASNPDYAPTPEAPF